MVESESLSDRDAGFCSGEDTDPDTGSDHKHADSTDTKGYVTDSNSPKKRRGDELPVDDDYLFRGAKLIKLELLSSPASPASPCRPCSEDSGASSPPFIKMEKSCSPVPFIKSCSPGPFRPWRVDKERSFSPSPEYSSPHPKKCPYAQEQPPALFEQEEQKQPLALVVKKNRPLLDEPLPLCRVRALRSTVLCNSERKQDPTLHAHPHPPTGMRVASDDDEEIETIPKLTYEEEMQHRRSISTPVIVARGAQSSQNGVGSSSSQSSKGTASLLSSHQQRNYKNMTRERRIEANARERTRVHTISAAFDKLRSSIPAYANNQKLSKLSVLRVACSYIMTLSRIAGYDYSATKSAPSMGDCVDNVCNTIQLEGKTRKKKEDGEN